MIKWLLGLFFAATLLFGKNPAFVQEVYNQAQILDSKFNIDRKIILAYVKTESDFNPYPILLKTRNTARAKLAFDGLKIKCKANEPYLAIYPINVVEAEFVYDIIQNNYDFLQVLDYDFGIMQLNTRTIKGYGANEKELYLDYKKNMLFGADIIRGCYTMLKSKTHISNILECYNRGVSISHLNRSPRTYLARFLENYNSIK